MSAKGFGIAKESTNTPFIAVFQYFNSRPAGHFQKQ
jgi:hypothetical protein